MALRSLKSLKNLFVFIGIVLTVISFTSFLVYSIGGTDKLKSLTSQSKLDWRSLKDAWFQKQQSQIVINSDDEGDDEGDDAATMDMSAPTVNQAELNQNMRLDGIKRKCIGERKSLSQLNEKQLSNLFRHIIFNDRYKFLYCVIPKVACSNWKRTIMTLEERVDDPNIVNKVNHRNFTYLSDLPPEKIIYRLRNYFKFMFVRPPLERLVSAYRNKFATKNLTAFHRSFGRKIVKTYRTNSPKNAKGDDVTFTEFVKFIIDTKPENMNEHWMPYVDLCQPCSVTYDFIGTLETLEEDVNHVLKRVGAVDVTFPKRQKYYIPTTEDKVSKYINQLPPQLKRNLITKYEKDLSLFQYKPY